jgi:hypothetical protein
LGIIHASKCHYRKQLILKTVVTIGGIAPSCCINEAVYVVFSITTTTIKNFFVKCGFSIDLVKCGFSIDHVSSNDGSAVKLSEDEEDNWHSLQPVGLQSEDYPTCDRTLEACRLLSINQVIDQHLTRPEYEVVEELFVVPTSVYNATIF